MKIENNRIENLITFLKFVKILCFFSIVLNFYHAYISDFLWIFIVDICLFSVFIVCISFIIKILDSFSSPLEGLFNG